MQCCFIIAISCLLKRLKAEKRNIEKQTKQHLVVIQMRMLVILKVVMMKTYIVIWTVTKYPKFMKFFFLIIIFWFRSNGSGICVVVAIIAHACPPYLTHIDLISYTVVAAILAHACPPYLIHHQSYLSYPYKYKCLHLKTATFHF